MGHAGESDRGSEVHWILSNFFKRKQIVVLSLYQDTFACARKCHIIRMSYPISVIWSQMSYYQGFSRNIMMCFTMFPRVLPTLLSSPTSLACSKLLIAYDEPWNTCRSHHVCTLHASTSYISDPKSLYYKCCGCRPNENQQ